MARDKMFAEVVIAGSYKQLSKATKGASNEMKGFGKTAKKISLGVKAAWAGGIAIGLDFLWDGLRKVGKASQEEAKSVAVLRNAMNNAWHATDKMSASQETYITKMQNMTAIADDKLRPAYAKIVRVTKNSTKAQAAFSRVLNISAGTGKDVNLVAQAYSKYLGGNKTALDKLIPGLKNQGDKLAFIDKTYKDAAKTIGDTQPFEKVDLIFQDIQERLGTYILPFVQDFANWLAGPEAQKMVDDMFTGIQNMFDYLRSPEGSKALQEYVDGFKSIAKAVIDMGKAISENKWFFDMMGQQMTNSPIAIAGRLLNGQNAFVNPNAPAPAVTDQIMGSRYQTGGQKVDVYLDGKQVATAIRRAAGQRGVTPAKFLGIG